MNKKKNVINICAALVTFIVQLFISFWLSPFVVGKLGEEAYGFINLANNFVSYASLLAVMVNSMASRYISVAFNDENNEEAKGYFNTVFYANCFIFCLVLFFSVFLIARLEHIINISPELIFQVKLTFAFSFINMGVSLFSSVYTSAAFSTNNMHYNSIVQIISNVAKSILIFGLFTLLPSKIYYFSAAMLLGGIITFFGNYYVSSKLFGEFKISKKYFEQKKLVILIKSGIWVLISNISNLLLNGLDLLLSNWFISDAMMGRLSLAKQIPYAFSSALGMFSNIFASSLTISFAKDGNNGLIEETKGQLKILTLIFTVPYAGVFIFGKSFLALWLGNTTYTDNQIKSIYVLMIIILIDIIVSTYMYSIHSIFIALDKVRIYSVILIIAGCISSVTTIILLNTTSLGLYAIAGTSTVVLGVAHGIIVPAFAATLLNTNISTFWKSELRSWILFTVISLVFIIVKQMVVIDNWSNFLVIVLIAGSIGYVISFGFIFSKDEKKHFIKMIKKKRNKINEK